jgi:hypothetical protein
MSITDPFFLKKESYLQIKKRFNYVNDIMKHVCSQNYMVFRLNKVNNYSLSGLITLITTSGKIEYQQMNNTELEYGRIHFNFVKDEQNNYYINVTTYSGTNYLNIEKKKFDNIHMFLKKVLFFITLDLVVQYPTQYVIDRYNFNEYGSYIFNPFKIPESNINLIKKSMVLTYLQKEIGSICIQSDLKIRKIKNTKTLKAFGPIEDPKINVPRPRTPIKFYKREKSHNSYRTSSTQKSNSHKKRTSKTRRRSQEYSHVPIRSDDTSSNVNIGLLLITCHGEIIYESTRLGHPPFIEIPREIQNTYYRSFSKPGLVCYFTQSTPISPQVSPTFDEEEKYEYDEDILQTSAMNGIMYSRRHQRNVYEKIFRKFKDKLHFYKQFFDIGFDYKKKYMRDIKTQITTGIDSYKKKLFYDPLQNNGKVTKLLNKSYSAGVNTVEDKIIFIIYNTTTKQYEKYDLLNIDVVRGIIVKFLKAGILTGADRPTKAIIDRIVNNLKLQYRKITMEDILFIIKNFNLDYLYIYDESCGVFNIKPEMIRHYTVDLPEEERLTQPQLEEEITKEIYRDFRKENAGI